MSHDAIDAIKRTGVDDCKSKDTPECTPVPAEVAFDKAVYGGISYAAQAATGIVLTNWLRNKGGKKYFEYLAEKFSGTKGPEALERSSSFIIVGTMIMVGNTFLAPVKWLEDRKPQIVRWLQNKFNARQEANGYHLNEEAKAQQEARLHALESEPKQTWGSLLSGRIFGLAAVVATERGLGGKFNEFMSKSTSNAIQEGLHAVGAKKLASSKEVKNYLDLAFYDAFYSAVSAGGLYAYSHLICPPTDKTAAEDPHEDTPQAQVSAASVTPAANQQHASLPAPASSHTERARQAEQQMPAGLAV